MSKVITLQAKSELIIPERLLEGPDAINVTQHPKSQLIVWPKDVDFGEIVKRMTDNQEFLTIVAKTMMAQLATETGKKLLAFLERELLDGSTQTRT